MTSGKLAVEGISGFKVSPKSKSASLTSSKKTHHSSSVSDEGGLASPFLLKDTYRQRVATFQLMLEKWPKEKKKGKLKFATLGGFSSKRRFI